MAKKQKTQQIKTNVYFNKDKQASITRLDIAPSKDGSYYAAVFSRTPEALAPIKEVLGEKGIVAQTKYKQSHVLVINGDSPEAILGTVQTLSDGMLQEDVIKKKWHQKIDLMKYRGHLGNVGQLFIIASALGLSIFDDNGKLSFKGKPKMRENSKGEMVSKYSGKKLYSTILSIIGNGINSYYGVQKKTDKVRTLDVKNRVNKILEYKGVDTELLPDENEKSISEKERKGDQPKTRLGKFHAWHRQFSIKTSNAIKLSGKYLYLLSGKEDENKGNEMHGYLSIAAKLSTLTGIDEDPYGYDKRKDPITWIRSKSNAISGFLEWLGNLSLVYGSISTTSGKDSRRDAVGLEKLILGDKVNKYEKDLKQWDWFQLVGAVAVGVGFVFKMLSPFTSKKIDVKEFTAHTAAGLAQVEGDKRTQILGDTVSHLMEMKELPEMRELGFAGTFAKIADDLEYRQGKAVRNRANEEQAVLLDEQATQAATKEADKNIAMAERVQDTAAAMRESIPNEQKPAENKQPPAPTAPMEQPVTAAKALVERGSHYLSDIKEGMHKQAEPMALGAA